MRRGVVLFSVSVILILSLSLVDGKVEGCEDSDPEVRFDVKGVVKYPSGGKSGQNTSYSISEDFCYILVNKSTEVPRCNGLECVYYITIQEKVNSCSGSNCYLSEGFCKIAGGTKNNPTMMSGGVEIPSLEGCVDGIINVNHSLCLDGIDSGDEPSFYIEESRLYNNRRGDIFFKGISWGIISREEYSQREDYCVIKEGDKEKKVDDCKGENCFVMEFFCNPIELWNRSLIEYEIIEYPNNEGISISMPYANEFRSLVETKSYLEGKTYLCNDEGYSCFQGTCQILQEISFLQKIANWFKNLFS